jgi:hypothetical protein
MEKLEMDVTSASEPVAQTPVDNPTHADEAFDASERVQMRLLLQENQLPEPVPLNPSSPPKEHSFKQLALSKLM